MALDIGQWIDVREYSAQNAEMPWPEACSALKLSVDACMQLPASSLLSNVTFCVRGPYRVAGTDMQHCDDYACKIKLPFLDVVLNTHMLSWCQ